MNTFDSLHIGAPERPCRCGSGLQRRALLDARGIFCAFVCDHCEKEKKAGFRPDIFTDSQYWTDEPVEEDDSYGAPGKDY